MRTSFCASLPFVTSAERSQSQIVGFVLAVLLNRVTRVPFSRSKAHKYQYTDAQIAVQSVRSVWTIKCLFCANDQQAIKGAKPVIAPGVELAEGVVIHQPDLVNLYGCRIGRGTRIGAFVEIQADVEVGANCKISSHSFLCSGVNIGDAVFIGHGVMFINDQFPQAVNQSGALQSAADWVCLTTTVEHKASIGTNATILGGIRIGKHALVGAGAVVTHDVPDYAVVAGVPARVIADRRSATVDSNREVERAETAG
jgi:UDP-2-acetamido-3-amino-2,3-dideoxy-glucuronate N-acetyltransferase